MKTLPKPWTQRLDCSDGRSPVIDLNLMELQSRTKKNAFS